MHSGRRACLRLQISSCMCANMTEHGERFGLHYGYANFNLRYQTRLTQLQSVGLHPSVALPTQAIRESHGRQASGQTYHLAVLFHFIDYHASLSEQGIVPSRRREPHSQPPRSLRDNSDDATQMQERGEWVVWEEGRGKRQEERGKREEGR
jgi:hypothetical protein